MVLIVVLLQTTFEDETRADKGLYYLVHRPVILFVLPNADEIDVVDVKMSTHW